MSSSTGQRTQAADQNVAAQCLAQPELLVEIVLLAAPYLEHSRGVVRKAAKTLLKALNRSIEW